MAGSILLTSEYLEGRIYTDGTSAEDRRTPEIANVAVKRSPSWRRHALWPAMRMPLALAELDYIRDFELT